MRVGVIVVVSLLENAWFLEYCFLRVSRQPLSGFLLGDAIS